MKNLFLLLTSLLLVGTTAAEAAPPVKKAELKVLYVGGTPEFETMTAGDIPADVMEKSIGERMRSFEEFLRDYFTSVTVVRAEEYTQKMSDDYDVTVMDGLPAPVVPRFTDREKGIYLQEGYLDEDFDRPMLTIGYLSDKLGRRIGTKNDWYCLCLQSDAHSWRPEHPIFNGPFEVNLTVVDEPTPEPIYNFPHHFEGGRVPETMPMWKVQTYDYTSADNARIGLVSRPGGYEDSPEAEYISSGVCAKSPDAVAIGRHGNFFHWGFAASPADMTEQAKPVLANAIVYISQFAGQTPIARKYNDRAATRSYARDLKQFLSRQAYEQSVSAEAEYNTMMSENRVKAEQKQARGEKLDQMDQIALSFTPSAPPTFEEYIQRSGRGLYEKFGMDLDAYGRYFDDNYDYFYCDGSYDLTVDEDAKSLGIPNNDKRLLDEAIRLWESGRDPEKGRRILLRYTLMDLPTAEAWRAWYDTYSDRLFFTESGGWVFLINSREPGLNDYRAHEERMAARRMASGTTSDAEPVAVAAETVVMQDGSRMLNIRADIHPGYHIYDNVAPSDTFVPTAVEITLPAGYTATGALTRPSGKFYNQLGTTVYKDSAVFSQRFTGSGPGQATCKITYQCCDPNICFPPETKEITVMLN